MSLNSSIRPAAIMALAALFASSAAAESGWRRLITSYGPPVTRAANRVSTPPISAGDPGCPTNRAVKNIVGSWLGTGADPNATDFRVLGTFMSDGTVIFSAQGEASSSPLFTADHGVWGCLGNGFVITFLEVNYDASGQFAGIFKLRGIFTLNATGDQADVNFFVEFTDAQGQPVFSGTGSGHSFRIKLEAPPQ